MYRGYGLPSLASVQVKFRAFGYFYEIIIGGIRYQDCLILSVDLINFSDDCVFAGHPGDCPIGMYSSVDFDAWIDNTLIKEMMIDVDMVNID